MRRPLAEFLGSFALVLAGTGAIVVNDASHGVVSHVGVSLVFGLVVMAMIDTLGDISGAHLNPAVTLGFTLARRFPLRDVPAYIGSQIAGALAASATLRLLFPAHPTLGATLPAGSASQSFILETILTALLMLTILRVSTGAKERGIVAAITIGGVIALEALFAGPISGASMNPARSLAPALLSSRVDSLWIYLAAPPLGAAVAVALNHALREPAPSPA